MKSLFIIGNGFDRAHGLKTSYEDFHTYLETKYPLADGNGDILPEGTPLHHIGVHYDINEVVSFLLYVISEAEPLGAKWSALESSLGNLNFKEYLDFVCQQVDKQGDPDIGANMENARAAAENILDVIKQIPTYFEKWINTIEIEEDTPICSEFADAANRDTDLFFTFNYTQTLERLYKAKNVYYIHGKQGGKLVLGHGNREDMTDKNMTNHYGAEVALRKIQDALRKDTAAAMEANNDFFIELTPDISKIYSTGFSFSKVDLIYIENICMRLPTENITWFLDNYNPEKEGNKFANERRRYKRAIKKCGFHGKFKTFSMSLKPDERKLKNKLNV